MLLFKDESSESMNKILSEIRSGLERTDESKSDQGNLLSICSRFFDILSNFREYLQNLRCISGESLVDEDENTSQSFSESDITYEESIAEDTL